MNNFRTKLIGAFGDYANVPKTEEQSLLVRIHALTYVMTVCMKYEVAG